MFAITCKLLRQPDFEKQLLDTEPYKAFQSLIKRQDPSWELKEEKQL